MQNLLFRSGLPLPSPATQHTAVFILNAVKTSNEIRAMLSE
jgi:hypothetical protein